VKKQGLAALSPEALKALGSKGGKNALENGTLHEFTLEEQRRGGQAGGRAVSSNRAHMSEIGKKGAAARARRQQAQQAGVQE